MPFYQKNRIREKDQQETNKVDVSNAVYGDSISGKWALRKDVKKRILLINGIRIYLPNTLNFN